MVAPPKLNLRRAAAYNAQDRGPLSSTSSRFNFNHLLFSPPPSPSLPALVPRRKKSQTKILATRPSQVIRRFVFLFGLLSVVYVVGKAYRSYYPVTTRSSSHTEILEVATGEPIPKYPAPIVVSDSNGQPRWTVSIPPEYGFPLTIEQYSGMSSQCREVAARVQNSYPRPSLSKDTVPTQDALDEHFIDVYEAERAGFLSTSGKGIPIKEDGHAVSAAEDFGNLVGVDKEKMAKMPVCQTSMTFVLESPDAGLGNSLMMMWSFYGLAKQQSRPFFIDATRWAYGNYTDIFQAPPVPECRPPPRHHMLPCPFQARHLVVSAVTAKDVFPALLAKDQHDSGTSNDTRDSFELARAGYLALAGLNEGDQRYVDSRVRVLKEKTKKGEGLPVQVPVIGLHVRRGDRHPMEQQYHGSYIPSEKFVETVEYLTETHYNISTKEEVRRVVITLVASDDPTVHDQGGFSKSLMAQERIRLASKVAIQEANPDPHILHNFVDETFGWEGGFYASMFWNLGKEKKNNAVASATDTGMEKAQETTGPSEQTLKLRNLIGRAYMMDLAVLGGASDSVVCTVSAMGCRLLAVMMGWDHAIEAGGWVNVDGPYEWTGINW